MTDPIASEKTARISSRELVLSCTGKSMLIVGTVLLALYVTLKEIIKDHPETVGFNCKDVGPVFGGFTTVCDNYSPCSLTRLNNTNGTLMPLDQFQFLIAACRQMCNVFGNAATPSSTANTTQFLSAVAFCPQKDVVAGNFLIFAMTTFSGLALISAALLVSKFGLFNSVTNCLQRHGLIKGEQSTDNTNLLDVAYRA